MREIKFRAWNSLIKRMSSVKRIDFQRNNFYTIYTKNSGGTSPTTFVLMQFTGLKDKNGKEIFEGDIVKNKNGYNFIVFWEEGMWKGKCNYSYVFYSLYGKEVIGNIYENPELLEEK